MPKMLVHLKNMLGSMPRPMSLDAKPVTAVTLGFGTGTYFKVESAYLTSSVTTGTALNIALHGKTMTTLATAVNAISGYTAVVTGGLGNIEAMALLDGVYNATGAPVAVPYYTAGLYQILMPVAHMLDHSEEDIEMGLRETDLRYADGVWVDRWGVLYGIVRSTGETDGPYARRINFSAVQPKTNNFAISLIIKQALGVATATVTDVGPAMFQVNLGLTDDAANPYDTSAINSFIKTYKALGTAGVLSLSSQGSEAYSTTSVVDTLIDTFETDTGESGAVMWARKEFG